MSPSTRNHWSVPMVPGDVADRAVLALRLVIMATSLYWLASGQLLWFVVGAVSTTLTFVPAVSIQDPALRAATSLCVSALVFAHIVFGMQFGFYETSAVYDKLMHVLGCSAIAAIVIAAVSQYCDRRRIKLPTPLLWVLVIGTVMSLGTLWEVFEFAIDRTGLFQAQRGLTDTMLDLVADTLGALATTSTIVGLAQRNIGVTP